MQDTLHATASPVYRQIYERTRHSILSGSLAPSARLPSARGLAAELGVARGTVDAAYALLLNEGLIEGRGARGTFVTQVPAGGPAAMPSLSATRRGREAEPYGLPFRLGLPALDAFPRKLWSRLVSRAGRKAPTLEDCFPDPAGLPRLRQEISTYLALARGVVRAPDAVIVSAGFQGALGLVVHALLRQGGSVLLEDPGYFFTRDALLAAGMKAVPAAVDGEGMDVGGTRQASIRLAVVTPSHQSPLGVTMSLRRRLALLEWARREDAFILEDDYDGEFRYASAPIPALASLDREGRVIYAGTFSKVFSPSLRIGYLAVPERLVARLRKVAASLAPAPSPIVQAALAEFMGQGHFTRHIRRMRALYAERRGALAESLEQVFGDTLRLSLQAGGMHLIGWPNGRTSDGGLERRARRAGLGPKALSAFSTAKAYPPGLLLGFCNIPAEQARETALRLRDALARKD
ncbi:MAG: PLP-dependent aminotransferase family protein [Parvibaculaceae bacterium]